MIHLLTIDGSLLGGTGVNDLTLFMSSDFAARLYAAGSVAHQGVILARFAQSSPPSLLTQQGQLRMQDIALDDLIADADEDHPDERLVDSKIGGVAPVINAEREIRYLTEKSRGLAFQLTDSDLVKAGVTDEFIFSYGTLVVSAYYGKREADLTKVVAFFDR
jgi:hypothetical protein